MSFEIRLVKDPERRLQSVERTRVHWDIGDSCMEFGSVKEAQILMDSFPQWAWTGTEVAKLLVKEKKK